jgi:hypothetical protein
MTIMQYKENHDRVLYADWKVQEFRSVRRFSEYRDIKSRLHQSDIILGIRQLKRRMWFSDHVLTIVIAATTVMLLLVAVVSILIALQII